MKKILIFSFSFIFAVFIFCIIDDSIKYSEKYGDKIETIIKKKLEEKSLNELFEVNKNNGIGFFKISGSENFEETEDGFVYTVSYKALKNNKTIRTIVAFDKINLIFKTETSYVNNNEEDRKQ